MLNIDMTPAQKAARTRAINKAWAKYDEVCKPSNDAFYAFAETLYPERNRIIDEAEAQRDLIIAEANAKCQAIWDAEMAKFDKQMETLEIERTTKRHEAFEILKAETAQFNFGGN
jgi:hypothetical protein